MKSQRSSNPEIPQDVLATLSPTEQTELKRVFKDSGSQWRLGHSGLTTSIESQPSLAKGLGTKATFRLARFDDAATCIVYYFTDDKELLTARSRLATREATHLVANGPFLFRVSASNSNLLDEIIASLSGEE